MTDTPQATGRTDEVPEHDHPSFSGGVSSSGDLGSGVTAPAAGVALRRKSSLTTLDWYTLNRACEPIWDAFGGTYLVGTAAQGGEYRDVDVRTILADDDFDRLCGDERVWTVLCTSIGTLLRQVTGMPIDYQIQRMTEANEKFPGGWRHPVGMVVHFAAGGDATRFATPGNADLKEKP